MPAENFDEAFLKEGINVYEVLRVVDYIPLFLEDHCKRFSHSLKGKNINFHCHTEALKLKLRTLIQKNDQQSGNIKIVYHYHQDDCFLIIYPVTYSYPSENDYKKGVDTLLMEEERPNPELKNWRPLFKEKVKELKKQKHVYEIILMNHDGIITEGSQSNLFFIQNNEIITTKPERILPGITRKYVYQICKMKKIRITEKDFTKENLNQYQSAFISGTSPKILPVHTIDGFVFDPAHPILKMIINEYDEIIHKYVSLSTT
ncbi:MAG: aminotransferase class IV [Bacteroidota bacterium]